MGKFAKVVLLTILVGIGVALTYFYFELIVSSSVSFIWDDLFDTEKQRWIVVPLCLALTLIYFGVQHWLDPKSEKQISEGLGEAPKPTVSNYVNVLFIGFLSLIAGASLGPEAILVPACLVLGSYVGLKGIGSDKKIVGLFAILGFVALIAAFFHSFIVGMLSLLLVKKKFKIDIKTRLVVLAALACGATIITLKIIGGSPYVDLPPYDWGFDITTIHFLLLLMAAGYLTTYVFGAVINGGKMIRNKLDGQWWMHGLVAGLVLSLLYILGGSLVEFTGNESIKPMLQQSTELGLIGLVWTLVIKILAIGWSKSIGYRGGMVFPSIFVASVLVAIAQIYMSDLNIIYGIIAALTGLLWADSRVKVLL